MTRRIICVAGLAMTVIFACTIAQADKIDFVNFSDAAGSQISADKTYTHKYDGGALESVVALVNGVQFDLMTHGSAGTHPMILTYGNLTYETFPVSPNTTGFNNGTWLDTSLMPNLTDGILNLMDDNIVAWSKHDHQILTLTGLTAGTEYDLRLYYHKCNSNNKRWIKMEFDDNGNGIYGEVIGDGEQEETARFDADASDKTYVSFISYSYTATASGAMTVKITPDNPDNGWHFCGMTNEVVSVPEPSTLALLACGLLGLLAYAWRKRK